MAKVIDRFAEARAAGSDWYANSKLAVIVIGSLAVLLASTILQVSFGAYPLTLSEAWRTVFDTQILFSADVWRWAFLGADIPEWLTRQQIIVWNLRLPRILVGAIVGANLAVSGAIFQIITRNELASPYILGVSDGAGLVVLLTLTMFYGLKPFLPIFAALGGAIAFGLVYVVAWKNGTSPVRLVLAGVVVGTVFGSVQRALFFFIDDLAIAMSAQAWLSGNLMNSGWEQVRIALPFTVLAMILMFSVTQELDVLLLGGDTADSLGMPVEKVRFAVAGIGVLATAAAIAVAGLIGFVGLIVPHMVRNIIGSDSRRMLIGCLFLGPALLVFADVGARLALSPAQLPVGVITGIVGGPYFLYLMRKKENLGEV